jgi:hypothetical protein
VITELTFCDRGVVHSILFNPIGSLERFRPYRIRA